MKTTSIILLLLLLLAVVTFSASFAIGSPWRDMLINLSAGFISSIVTVFVVDKLLTQERAQRYKGVTTSGLLRMQRVVNRSESAIRRFLEVAPPTEQNLDMVKLKRLVIDEITDLTKFVVEVDYVKRTSEQWAKLKADLEKSDQEIASFVAQFGSLADPQQLDSLLALQDALSGATMWFEIFPEVAVLSVEEANLLGRKYERWHKMCEMGFKQGFRKLLQCCADLLSRIPDDALREIKMPHQL